MVYLLDTNCVIALFDCRHVNHEDAHAWFVSVFRWAVSPIKENGVIRILSHPSYPTVITTPQEVANHLARFYEREGFVFWTDDVSLVRDLDRPDRALLIGHNQVSDWYLAFAGREKRRQAGYVRPSPDEVDEGYLPRRHARFDPSAALIAASDEHAPNRTVTRRAPFRSRTPPQRPGWSAPSSRRCV